MAPTLHFRGWGFLIRIQWKIWAVALAAMVLPGGAEAVPPEPLPDCVLTFAQLHASIEGDLSPYQPFVFGEAVNFVRSDIGPRGGKIWTLERPGDTWSSIRGDTPVAPQGDPRWFANVFGQGAAEHFGFSRPEGARMKIPDAQEFIQGYAALQSKLAGKGQEPLSLGFKATTSEKKQMSYIGYLKQFRDARALPIAPDGLTLVHDLSFHTPAMILPKRYVDFVAVQTDAVLNFTAELRKIYHETGKPPWLNEVIHYIRARQVSDVDVSTARVGQAINLHNLFLETEANASSSQKAQDLKKHVADIIRTGTSDGATSVDHVAGQIPDVATKFLKGGDGAKSLSRSNHRKLMRYYRQWVKSIPETHSFRNELDLTVDELCRLTQANRERVISALTSP